MEIPSTACLTDDGNYLRTAPETGYGNNSISTDTGATRNYDNARSTGMFPSLII